MDMTKDEFKVLIQELLNAPLEIDVDDVKYESNSNKYYHLSYIFDDRITYDGYIELECGCVSECNGVNMSLNKVYEYVMNKMKGDNHE